MSEITEDMRWYFIQSCPMSKICDLQNAKWQTCMGVWPDEIWANNYRLELQSKEPDRYFSIFRANTPDYGKLL